MAFLLWQRPTRKGNREAGDPIGVEPSITAGEPKANPRTGSILQWDPMGVQLPVTAGRPQAHPRSSAAHSPAKAPCQASRRLHDVGMKFDPMGSSWCGDSCPRVRCAYPVRRCAFGLPAVIDSWTPMGSSLFGEFLSAGALRLPAVIESATPMGSAASLHPHRHHTEALHPPSAWDVRHVAPPGRPAVMVMRRSTSGPKGGGL